MDTPVSTWLRACACGPVPRGGCHHDPPGAPHQDIRVGAYPGSDARGGRRACRARRHNGGRARGHPPRAPGARRRPGALRRALCVCPCGRRRAPTRGVPDAHPAIHRRRRGHGVAHAPWHVPARTLCRLAWCRRLYRRGRGDPHGGRHRPDARLRPRAGTGNRGCDTRRPACRPGRGRGACRAHDVSVEVPRHRRGHLPHRHPVRRVGMGRHR